MDSDGKGQFRWKYRIRLQWDKEGIEGLLRSEEKHGVECVREDYHPRYFHQYKNYPCCIPENHGNLPQYFKTIN